jgi:uncharacterized membrane protein YoaK (UPF0700 family)
MNYQLIAVQHITNGNIRTDNSIARSQRPSNRLIYSIYRSRHVDPRSRPPPSISKSTFHLQQHSCNISVRPTFLTDYYHTVYHIPLSHNMGSPRSLSIPSRSLRNSSNHYWRAELQPNNFIVFLLLCLTFVTGIQDAISFIDYRCLHSAQTGNTVLLGVSVFLRDSRDYRPAISNAATSLACFFSGAYLTGQLGAIFGHRARAWQFGVGITQTIMLVGVAIVQHTHPIRERGLWTRIALALLAGQSGSQIAAARAWNIPEITTAMATAAWVDLARDDKLWHVRNRSRDRRILFFVLLVAGCLMGAFLRARIGSPNAIVVSLSFKALVHCAVLFAKVDEDDEIDGTSEDGVEVPL